MSNYIKWNLTTVFMLFFTFQCQAQKENRNNFEVRKCNQSHGVCDCEVDILKRDTNISLVYHGNHRLTVSDENMNCMRTDLIIYDRKIWLDSIYWANIQNKTLAYMSGFCGYKYTERNRIVTLTLT